MRINWGVYAYHLGGVWLSLTLFRDIQAGRDTNQDTWIEFQLADGEYDQIESTLQQDGVLSEFVEKKIRWVDFRDRDNHG